MNSYDDILALPHHTSRKHPRMSRMNRAAQFSPFALTGYDEAIADARRLTDIKTDLDEYPIAILDRKYQQLSKLTRKHPQIIITRFVPDVRKVGGSYETISGKLKRIDPYTQCILLSNGCTIPFSHIVGLECDLLEDE